MKRKIFSILIALVLISSMTFSTLATTKSDLQNQASDLEKNIDQATEDIEAIEIELSEALKEVKQLSSEISSKEAEIEELEKELSELKAQIKKTEEELEEAQANYDKQQELLQARLVASYKAGETSYLDVLLNSASLSDFISNYHLVSQITQYDAELLENINAEKAKIENTKAELESKQSELKIANAKITKESTILKNKKILKNSYVSKLSKEEKNLQKELDQYESELKAVESQLKAIEQQYSSATVENPYTGGTMTWPVPGYYKISSYFGYRTASGVVSAYHGGVDIVGTSAGQIKGANIVAAADGIVTLSRWSSSAGNWVNIYHGNGLYTVYMHAETLIAKEGQTVKAGDVIAKVGTTGNSTGYHLHFAVRLNGTYVNPAPYLGI